MLNPMRILFTFLLIIFGSTVNGQWSIDPTVNTPICLAPGDQSSPSIVALDNDEYIIFWIDRRNGDRDVYAQKIDVFGAIKWGINGIPICDGPGEQQAYKAKKKQ